MKLGDRVYIFIGYPRDKISWIPERIHDETDYHWVLSKGQKYRKHDFKLAGRNNRRKYPIILPETPENTYKFIQWRWTEDVKLARQLFSELDFDSLSDRTMVRLMRIVEKEKAEW